MHFASAVDGHLIIPQDIPKVESPSGGAGPAPAPGTPQTQANPNQPTGGGATGSSDPFGGNLFLIMALVIGVMLFMSFRRESKAKKEQQAMLASIKQGDTVITTSGIHGVVHRLENNTVTLVLDTAKVTFDRAAIARVVRDQAATKSA